LKEFAEKYKCNFNKIQTNKERYDLIQISTHCAQNGRVIFKE